MSYILEALKKSDAERKRGEVPTLGDAPTAPTYTAQPGTRPLSFFVAGALGVIAIGAIGAWLMLGGDETPEQAQHVAPQLAASQQAGLTPPQPEPTPEPAPEPEPEPEL